MCIYLTELYVTAFTYVNFLFRFLGHLGTHVRNRNQPEGSIAEGYLAEECVTFCTRYLNGIETMVNRPVRNDDYTEIRSGLSTAEATSIFVKQGRPLGRGEIVTFEHGTLFKAHQYVLHNCDHVSPFIEYVHHNSFTILSIFLSYDF